MFDHALDALHLLVDGELHQAVVVLLHHHLHPRGDGGSLRGVEGGVNCVVQDTVGPVIAETFIIIVSTYVRMDCVTD